MVQEQVALCRAPTLGMGVGMRGWTFGGGPDPPASLPISTASSTAGPCTGPA